VLDALGDPTRRVILEVLRRGGPSSVGALAERVPVSRPAISQHLKVLGAVGLVNHESRGTRNIYRVDHAGLDELRAWLDRFWGDVLDAYSDHIRWTEGQRTDEERRQGQRTDEERRSTQGQRTDDEERRTQGQRADDEQRRTQGQRADEERRTEEG
jgi:DNA-binding transcriptional ArsR family regulator